MTPDQAAAVRAILHEPSYEQQLLPDLLLEGPWLAAQAERHAGGNVTLAASSAARIARIFAFLAQEIDRGAWHP